MHATSSTWATLLNNPVVSKNEKLVIAGQTYYNANMYSGGIIGDLMSKPEDVGNAISRQLSVVLDPLSSIPRAAQIEYYVQLAIRGSDNSIVQASEWIQKGIFYIDTREEDPETGLISIVAFDKMLSANTPYLHEGYIGEWPRTDIDVVDDICTLMNVSLDSGTRSFLNKGYQIPYPGVDDDGLTKREILSNIGVLYCGNFMITDDEKLRLVPIEGLSTSTALVLDRDITKLRVAQTFPPYSCITMYDTSDREYVAGSVSANTRELDLTCAWASQAAVNNILARIGNWSYKPYTAQKALIDPAYELGDRVTVTNTVSVLNSMSWNFGRSLLVNLSTPFDQEVDHEYPYDATLSREVKRKVSLGKSYYGVTITKEEGIRVDRDDGKSEAIFNSDLFAMRALIDGVMKDRIYFDPIKGDYVFDGALGADAVFTDSLYAEQGDIAELTVDRLSTSRRVRLYNLRNTGDDNYLEIQDNYLRLITGTVIFESGSPLTEQATNRSGQGLYWSEIPYSINAQGYPMDEDGNQIYATTDQPVPGEGETLDQYKVMVYQYSELVKAELAFFNESGTYVPKMVMGAGDNQGRTKGILHKSANGFDISFTDSNGNEQGLRMLSAGYMDLYGLRKPTELDFSGWNSGYFSEELDGQQTASWLVDFDSQGRPILITDGDGHETAVVW